MIRGHIRAYSTSAGVQRYRIRLDYGRDAATGKRPQPYHSETYASVKAAERALVLLLHTLNSGPRPDPTRRTVTEVLAEWLDVEARNDVRPKTLAGYESCCRVHLVPHLGGVRLDKLSTGMIEQYRARHLAEGHSTRMVELAALHLHQALAYAVRHGYLTYNPAADLKPLRHEHREMLVWSQEEAKRFLAAAREQSYHPLWHLALYTGMRKGELLALTWEDVDLARARLQVRRSMSLGEPGATKTSRARVIDLDTATVAILREHRIRQGERRLRAGTWHEGNWLLTTGVGTPLSEYNTIRAMDQLVARIGVTRIRFHDMRHTAASLLLAAGRPVHIVSRMLGHASAATTLRIYAHLMEGQGEETAALMGRLLGG